MSVPANPHRAQICLAFACIEVLEAMDREAPFILNKSPKQLSRWRGETTDYASTIVGYLPYFQAWEAEHMQRQPVAQALGEWGREVQELADQPEARLIRAVGSNGRVSQVISDVMADGRISHDESDALDRAERDAMDTLAAIRAAKSKAQGVTA